MSGVNEWETVEELLLRLEESDSSFQPTDKEKAFIKATLRDFVSLELALYLVKARKSQNYLGACRQIQKECSLSDGNKRVALVAKLIVGTDSHW